MQSVAHTLTSPIVLAKWTQYNSSPVVAFVYIKWTKAKNQSKWLYLFGTLTNLLVGMKTSFGWFLGAYKSRWLGIAFLCNAGTIPSGPCSLLQLLWLGWAPLPPKLSKFNALLHHGAWLLSGCPKIGAWKLSTLTGGFSHPFGVCKRGCGGDCLEKARPRLRPWPTTHLFIPPHPHVVLSTYVGLLHPPIRPLPQATGP